MTLSTEPIILSTKIRINSELRGDFADWQAKLHGYVAAFPGFVSLEIISPLKDKPFEWIIEQRFNSADSVAAWRKSTQHQELQAELKKLLSTKEKNPLEEIEVQSSQLQGGVTEVFVTQVNPQHDKAFKEWIAKIHQVEAKFPGFKGVYVQSPKEGQGKDWITLLQFDSPKNLDKWIASPERQEVLKDSNSLVASIESHRLISTYGGWFANLAKTGELPPVWKQTMIVLLVLFPIVMVELKYLNPSLTDFNHSIATFIGNAISVALISWPMMPIAIFFLGWWLSPQGNKLIKTIVGTLLVIGLYLAEILFFWYW